MTKRFSLALIAVVALAMLILPASAAVNQIAQGGDVFIGEEGLDVSVAVGAFTQVAWFASGTNPSTDTPNAVLAVGTPAAFYVAPADFVGKTGNWYRWDGGATRNQVSFNVVDPNIALKIWDQNANKDVTGKSVPTGNFENFRIETNIYSVTARPGYAGEGFVNIRVKTADGATYTAMFQSTAVSLPLTGQVVDSSLWYWVPAGATTQGWNTGVMDVNGARMYKAGVYTVYAEVSLNKLKDNYKAPDGSDYTGKTVTTTNTVTIASDTVKIEASKDVVVRGNPFSITVTGRPNTYYAIWVKGTGQMTGIGTDQPPLLLADQKDVSNDPVGGPYDIGTYEYEGGAGRTIKEDVPTAPDNGVYYYAAVKTSNSGTITVGFTTGSDTKDKKYTLRVERGPGALNMPAPWDVNLFGTAFKSDEVDVKVEKGTVTVVAAGDQSYFLGQEVKLSGTNSETDTVYLFITGPNLPGNGGKLTDPRSAVTNNIAVTFTNTDVLDDNTWEYKWQTANLNIDAGTYTVYAVATPNDKNNLGNAQYATVSLIVRKPFVSATASQSTVASGDKFYLRGVAEGQPSQGVAIWIMGKNFVLYDTESVNSDGTFEKEVTEGVTANMASGQYFVVVQHPMYNDNLDVYPRADAGYAARYVVGPYPIQGAENIIFTLQGPGSLQGSDAAEALVVALDNPSVDDTYTKLQFLIEEPSVRISPITEKMVGDKFEIKGTTNLAVDDELLVEVVSSSFQPTQKTQSGEFSGATGTVKVVKGTEGFNTWAIPVDTTTFKPDEYIVTVAGVTVDVTANALFNIVEVQPTTVVTTVPPTTGGPTAPPTTVPPTAEPTPTTPGFGALVALVGLGAVAFLIVRKH
ncbi:MAG TPA: MEMAR_RS02690 family S-layer glycoprotein [Methanoregulaceae archaeon]|nr:MEMAR_RS02690 family S-layer glycoprotein [Methanoregulaceae archaeon]